MMMAPNEDETKIIYYIDDKVPPYMITVPVPLDRVTLYDFKSALKRTNYRFLFRSVDTELGVVRQEIVDDTSRLPASGGRVVSWLETTDNSNASDNAPQEMASTTRTFIQQIGPVPICGALVFISAVFGIIYLHQR